MPSILQVSNILHYSCSSVAVVFVSVVTILNAARTTGKTTTPRNYDRIAIALLILGYLAEGIATFVQESQQSKEPETIHLVVLGSLWAFIWSQRAAPRLLVLGTSLITLAFEIPLQIFSALNSQNDVYHIIQLASQTFRLLPLLFLMIYHLSNSGRFYTPDSEAEESQPFLQSNGHANGRACPSYGTETSSDTEVDDDEYISGSETEEDVIDIKRQRAKKLKEKGGWLGYLSDFSIFLPFLIPKKDRKVQLCILISLFCILATRVFNILVPRQLGIVADQLLAKQNPFHALFIWLIMSLASHDVVVGLIESLAKIPIKQYSYRSLTNAAFNHVLSLPMEFHSERDSAEVMKAIEQGEALTNVLDMLIIEILPTVIDLAIAFVFLYWKFNSYVALAMAIGSVLFVTFEVKATGWNLDNRRESTKSKREEVRVMHQAVQGWQTVTYFNMFNYEKYRFGSAVNKQLSAGLNFEKTDAYIQLLLNALIPCTFFTLATLVIYDVWHGASSPGDFVFFIQYWEYLVWPLKFLSHSYRQLMSDLVDAERLLYLLQTKPTITDKEGAKDLEKVEGRVAFHDVCFSYDPRKPTVQDLSLSVEPGQTIALVGETGAGKSSIMKLLLRFYDIDEGSITIDGYDIRDITLSSLRNALGVVPQDPLLFNASILENMRYARPSATDEEIYAACRSAAIHDKILSFVDGYNTEVGEQGVKLSGGEIQRLAIARVFLKNPPILILDEATSAVDTNTESSIQGALDELKRARSTFVIAHRLSTIVSADKILVIHNGQVVESGTHAELISIDGRYKELWNKQVGNK
ncbi:vacuolar membrane protein HMT1 [Fusarium fujikuroi]|nr:vacuolar membrane protein HMT1 [Fusarium fujikuroi]